VGDDVGGKLLFWRNTCVGYDLQQDASRQVTLEKATSLAASAFAGWHDVSCADGRGPSLNAVDLGPVACSEVRYNKANANQNVIVFRDDVWPHNDPTSTLGLTTVTFDVNTGEIFGADMEINSTLPLIVNAARAGGTDDSQVAAVAATPAGYDLATIISHEAGHFLGLAHSALGSAMMAAHYKEDGHMSDDDIAGICAAYPSDGKRPTGRATTHPSATTTMADAPSAVRRRRTEPARAPSGQRCSGCPYGVCDVVAGSVQGLQVTGTERVSGQSPSVMVRVMVAVPGPVQV
jgi:hypothetical protein